MTPATPGLQDPASGSDVKPVEGIASQPVHRVFYPALDGVRCVAFLVIFFHHYLRNNWGWVGVDIFFVLSGFLITGILFQTRDRPHRFSTFYIRRVLRIFPLYYGVFAVLLLLTPLLHLQWNRYWVFWVLHLGNYLRDFPPSTFAGTTGDVPYGILYTSTPWVWVYAGHFWSLCLEEQFYLLWPVVVFGVRRRGLLLALCLTYFAALFPVRWWMRYAHLPHTTLDGLSIWSLPLRADALLLGAALALWLLHGAGARVLRSQARVSPIFAVGLALVAGWLLTHHTFDVPVVGDAFTYPVVDVAAVCLIFEALRPSSLVAVLLSWRPLRQAGKLTYGAYVFHDLPHTYYYKAAQHALPSATPAALTYVTAAIALVCTAVLAWASFRFYESRFLRLKDRFGRE